MTTGRCYVRQRWLFVLIYAAYPVAPFSTRGGVGRGLAFPPLCSSSKQWGRRRRRQRACLCPHFAPSFFGNGDGFPASSESWKRRGPSTCPSCSSIGIALLASPDDGEGEWIVGTNDPGVDDDRERRRWVVRGTCNDNNKKNSTAILSMASVEVVTTAPSPRMQPASSVSRSTEAEVEAEAPEAAEAPESCSAERVNGGDDRAVRDGTANTVAAEKEEVEAPTTTATSIILLNVVAVLWGTQHAVIKSIVMNEDHGGGGGGAGVFGLNSLLNDDSVGLLASGAAAMPDSSAAVVVGPAFFTLARFVLAAAVATLGMVATTAPEATDDRNRDKTNVPNGTPTAAPTTASATTTTAFGSNAVQWGLEMGLYMFLGFAFQAIGLQYTTASKSGFLLYLNVKFVPILAYLLWGRALTVSTVASALAAFVGTSLLATNGHFDATNLNVGDAWSVAAALASAMFILRLEQASLQVPNAAALNSASLWTVSFLSFVWWTLTRHDSLEFLWHDAVHDAIALAQTHLPELLYLSVVATAVTNWIQTIAQRDVPAERASIIYAMDPVYGALFAHLWLGENLDGAAAWIGAALIVVAAATNALLDLPTSTVAATESKSTATSPEKP